MSFTGLNLLPYRDSQVTNPTYDFRTNKNEISIVGEEYKVVMGQKLADIDRFYKIWSLELELNIDEEPSEEVWLNILNLGPHVTENTACGDRMPLVSIARGASLGLHIGKYATFFNFRSLESAL